MATDSLDFALSAECIICMQTLKEPRMLPCRTTFGHTFCTDCIAQLISTSKIGGGIKCPLCNVHIDIPPEGASGFMKNGAADQLVEEMEKLKVAFERMKAERDALKEQKDATTAAAEKGNGKEVTKLCKKHLFPCNLFCAAQKCQVAICGKCVISTHKDHVDNVIDINERAKKAKAGLRELLEKINGNKEELKTHKAELEALKEDHYVRKEAIYDQIEIIKQVTYQAIEENIQSLRSEVFKRTKAEVEKVEQRQDECTVLIDSYNETTLHLQQTLQLEDSNDVIDGCVHVKENVSGLVDIMAEITNNDLALNEVKLITINDLQESGIELGLVIDEESRMLEKMLEVDDEVMTVKDQLEAYNNGNEAEIENLKDHFCPTACTKKAELKESMHITDLCFIKNMLITSNYDECLGISKLKYYNSDYLVYKTVNVPDLVDSMCYLKGKEDILILLVINEKIKRNRLEVRHAETGQVIHMHSLKDDDLRTVCTVDRRRIAVASWNTCPTYIYIYAIIDNQIQFVGKLCDVDTMNIGCMLQLSRTTLLTISWWKGASVAINTKTGKEEFRIQGQLMNEWIRPKSLCTDGRGWIYIADGYSNKVIVGKMDQPFKQLQETDKDIERIAYDPLNNVLAVCTGLHGKITIYKITHS